MIRCCVGALRFRIFVRVCIPKNISRSIFVVGNRVTLAFSLPYRHAELGCRSQCQGIDTPPHLTRTTHGARGRSDVYAP